MNGAQIVSLTRDEGMSNQCPGHLPSAERNADIENMYTAGTGLLDPEAADSALRSFSGLIDAGLSALGLNSSDGCSGH